VVMCVGGIGSDHVCGRYWQPSVSFPIFVILYLLSISVPIFFWPSIVFPKMKISGLPKIKTSTEKCWLNLEFLN